jgi:hypothetical protein
MSALFVHARNACYSFLPSRGSGVRMDAGLLDDNGEFEAASDVPPLLVNNDQVRLGQVHTALKYVLYIFVMCRTY